MTARVTRLLSLVAVVFCAALPLAAQNFPTRPVKIIVPFGAGGITDLYARQIADRVAPSLGQPIVVENRPGQGGSLAPGGVARAEPDGHTLLLAGSANTFGESLYKNLPFSILRDFVPVVRGAAIVNVLFVHPSVKATSVSDLIALAKSQPGKLTYASSGYGGGYHLAMEMFKSMAGTNILHVPYRTETAGRTDVVAGVADMMISAYGVVIPHAKAGQVRILAVTSPSRFAALPDIPTIAETGLAGYDGDAWIGLLAPAGTPAPIVERIHTEVSKAMRDPDLRAKLADSGMTTIDETSAQFGQFLKQDVERWRKVIEVSGIKIE